MWASTVPLTQLLNSDARGANEIAPPLIVRFSLKSFPFHEGRSTTQDNVFSRRLLSEGACRGQSEDHRQQGVAISHVIEHPRNAIFCKTISRQVFSYRIAFDRGARSFGL
jgi:hypothetical protein